MKDPSMASKADEERKEAKRQAVVAQLKEIHPNLDALSGMLDEHQLDLLALALNVGKVELTEK